LKERTKRPGDTCEKFEKSVGYYSLASYGVEIPHMFSMRPDVPERIRSQTKEGGGASEEKVIMRGV